MLLVIYGGIGNIELSKKNIFKKIRIFYVEKITFGILPIFDYLFIRN